MVTTSARQKLRALLDDGELIVAPGVFDGITAHLAQRTGQAAYVQRHLPTGGVEIHGPGWGT